MLKKLTPVLVVEDVAAQLPFWVDCLEFEKTVEVPHEEAIGFVILAKDGVEVMLQSIASVAADVPALKDLRTTSALFIEVSDINLVENRLGDRERVFPRRTTFYGAIEVGVRDPAGNIVTFAQFGGDGQ